MVQQHPDLPVSVSDSRLRDLSDANPKSSPWIFVAAIAECPTIQPGYTACSPLAQALLYTIQIEPIWVTLFAMFEITPDDIALLNDADLRTIVGLLCEEEARRRNLSTSFVTYGGHQDAADDGVDVNVAFPPGTPIEGFVPRPSTVFQTKKEDMPRKKTIDEMRPLGILRPVIQQLTDQVGAYIIVSSTGSTSRRALKDRHDAMSEAVKDIPNASDLILDFYDRTRLATWVRDHAGLILWVRNRVGRAIPGWRAYGAWACPQEGLSGEYLVDDKLRIRTGRLEDGGGLQALGGIKRIRDLLRQPQAIIRLVGLSGFGKTRLVQALFDSRVGEQNLDPALAFYTNIADDPDPQPTALASDLIANRKRAILVIDNCTPDLHRRLAEVCRSPESMISVITIEYDIREDEPEGTEVFRLESSSRELIEKLVTHRFPELSVVNVRTIAEFSGGNARIAIALAGTIDKTETIVGLNDEELFQRLFRQRHQDDPVLMLAAQACSLVYSFQGEELSGQGQLARLGALVGKSAQDLFQSVAELQSRELVQRRGEWRAVLPHAVANRLAATALKTIPIEVIQEQLVTSGSEHLLKSFSRRLGYLGSSEIAKAIVQKWLGVGGLLDNLATLDDLGKTIFHNIAPASPEAALSALERTLLGPKEEEASRSCEDYLRLIRLLAYDATLFERSALMSKISGAAGENVKSKFARMMFASLFFIYLSGTHATVEQRLAIIKPLLLSDDAKKRDLGIMALKAALEGSYFSAFDNFEFGAHSRDYGYWPTTREAASHWFGLTLTLAGTLACSDSLCAPQARGALAEEFRSLWTGAQMYEELEQVCNAISKKMFWREGWIAIRHTIYYDSHGFSFDISARLTSLEELLRPKDLVQEVRSIVFSNLSIALDLGPRNSATNDTQAAIDRMGIIVQDLGKAVAIDDQSFSELLPKFVVAGDGQLWNFGQGLAQGAEDSRATWNRLLAQLAVTPREKQNFQVFGGFLNALRVKDPVLANNLLDDAVEKDPLEYWFPALQASFEIDGKGVDRIMRSVALGKAPIRMYRFLAGGRVTDPMSGEQLNKLLLEIASKTDGFDTAIEILYGRLNSIENQKQNCPLEIIDAGRELMRRITFRKQTNSEDYKLGIICKTCLIGEKGAVIVQQICGKLKDAISKYETFVQYNDDLLQGLFSVQPIASLNGFCAGDASDLKTGVRILEDIGNLRNNPLNGMPDDELLSWCDQEPKLRYPAAASVINLIDFSKERGKQRWSKSALRLLEKAPDRVEVLRQYVRRFGPTHWSGSLATVLESNAELLNQLIGHSDPAVVAFLTQEKDRLAKMIKEERRSENTTDRKRNERFE